MRGRALSDHYIDLAYSKEDGGYIADIPDLKACSAFGASPEEALAEVKKAKEAWLAAAREAGRDDEPVVVCFAGGSYFDA